MTLPTAATSATYTPTADATVNSGTLTTASGTSTQISASRIGTPYERSYLKFAVTGLGGRTITGARLNLTTTDASPVGGTLWTTANSWTETVTWATSPPAGTWLGRYGAATVGTTNALTIPASTLPVAVPNEGTWSFLLSSSSSDRVRYNSRESTTATARPALVVSLATSDLAAPSAPGTPTLTLAADRTTLTWAKATDDVAVTGYQVERNGVIVTTREGTTWTDTGITTGANTAYRVRALDAAGRTGPWSTAVTGTTP